MFEIEYNTSVACKIFDESSNRYGTFDIKAHILKATPVDLIIGRDSIKKFNLFSNVPSQLGIKVLTEIHGNRIRTYDSVVPYMYTWRKII